MKFLLNIFCSIVALTYLQSCKKESGDNEVAIDYFTYGAKFNWREDSIKVGTGDWTKVANGHVFSWLAPDRTLQNSNFASYADRTNIKADFPYVIAKDSVFAIKLSADNVYFLDHSNKQRTDVVGQVNLAPDSSLILINTAVSPIISIKYRLEN